MKTLGTALLVVIAVIVVLILGILIAPTVNQYRVQSPIVPIENVPVVEPTAQPMPIITWQGADTAYVDRGEWVGPFTCEGPAVCEWYKNGSPAGFGNEGFIFLKEGETVTFPAGYVGHSWGLPSGDRAIKLLDVSYRHLLFYADKPQHSYMVYWLNENGYGPCNFDDQTGCSALAPLVVILPDGLETNR